MLQHILSSRSRSSSTSSTSSTSSSFIMSSDSFRKVHNRSSKRLLFSNPWLSHLIAFVLGCIVTSFWIGGGSLSSSTSSLLSPSNALLRASSTTSVSDCAISFGPYHGSEYTVPHQTVGQPKCLVESKFLKVQQHAVQFTPKDAVITDWLWIDYHDRINVLVQAPPPSLPNDDNEIEFLVFSQTKYALEGRTSMAIVGGIIEPHEAPETAARREVEEEMQLQCQEFHFLGRFRTDVNRGVGWTNAYLATQCHKTATIGQQKQTSGSAAEQVGAADTERQDLQRVNLHDLRQAVVDGKFLEIQWSATVALALLHPELYQQPIRRI